MISLHSFTVSRVGAELQRQDRVSPEELMVGPTPANPLAWDIVVSCWGSFRWGRFDWRYGSLVCRGPSFPRLGSHPFGTSFQQRTVSRILALGAFSMVRDRIPTTAGRRVYLMDARYTRSRSSGFGATMIEPSTEWAFRLPAAGFLSIRRVLCWR